ncbi:MAG: DNA-3-methyladenine glycosylase 2 family protein [Saprospiraceae bacterium]|nr:DNA-3-methyladenine glycosylase 2 family protein [Bacteroidia bacterium]NNE15471.1 DNA-3-methyladenine glycosylase 2 family protein [Saprospiraceae bacterium]NNL92414.1 DNA-3-methyladenine glycosylase 2 family protein [Saprospiraceae bacterium]
MGLVTKKAKAHLISIPELTDIVKTIEPIYQPGAGNVFNELVKNIAYQQISYKAADSIYKRFTALMKTEVYTPHHILRADYDEVKASGFSYRKTDYIYNIANFFKEKKLYKVDWKKMDDEEIIQLLSQIKGVGVWTVQMILIFELQRPNVFPSLDLAVQLVMKDLFKLKSEKKALINEIEYISERWSPYKSLASLYLWGFRRKQLEKKK